MASTPTVTSSGYAAAGNSGNACCYVATFEPNSLASILHCCDTLAVHSAELICTYQDWMTAYDNSLAANSAPCPVSQARCCPVPYQLTEFVETAKITQTNKFAVDFYRVGRSVVIGKEEIRCDPDTEPECRWFVRVIDTYRYAASVNTTLFGEYSLTNTFLDPCYELASGFTNRSSTTTSCGSPDDCNSDPSFGSACINNRGASQSNSCFEGTGTFCIQRIKFFDTRPSGSITFLDTDTLAASGCDETECGPKCDTWSQEVCVSSPASILPPHWCSQPPTITRTETTCTPDYGFECASLLSFSTTDCEAFLVACNPATTCNNPASFTRVCEALSFPTWTINPEECRFNSSFVNFIYGGCPCSGNTAGLPDCLVLSTPRVFGKDCGTGCSNTACCDRLLCIDGATLLWCAPKRFANGFYVNNDLVVNITCGSYAQKSCCFAPGPTTINISWS